MGTLTISGVHSKVDGEYECDLLGLVGVDLTSPEALTGDEAAYIQDRSKVRGGELVDAFDAKDIRFLIALAVVVLERHDKRIPFETLMAHKIGCYRFDLGIVPDGEAEQPHPTVEGPASDKTSTPGGTASTTSSESLDDALAPIGAPV